MNVKHVAARNHFVMQGIESNWDKMSEDEKNDWVKANEPHDAEVEEMALEEPEEPTSEIVDDHA